MGKLDSGKGQQTVEVVSRYSNRDLVPTNPVFLTKFSYFHECQATYVPNDRIVSCG